MVKKSLKLALSITAKALFVVAVLYVGCYRLRSATLMEGDTELRVYGTAVEARMFAPLARIESVVAGRRIRSYHPR
jgi:hypothetical protein